MHSDFLIALPSNIFAINDVDESTRCLLTACALELRIQVSATHLASILVQLTDCMILLQLSSIVVGAFSIP
jgi:hypothetical protein